MGEPESFSCVLCGCKLQTKDALQEHFRKHANKQIDSKKLLRPRRMPTLPSSAAAVVQVLAQKGSETGRTAARESVSCDVCPMVFSTVTAAIQHKFKKHPDHPTKHYCQFCGMQFPLKCMEAKHIQTHSGMEASSAYPCPDCSAVFHNATALNYHIKFTHKRIRSIFKPVMTPPPSKKIKLNNANEAQSVYYCYLCGAEYIVKFNLQKHLERAHSAEERDNVPENLVKCTTCDALFYNKKGYDNHNLCHKPDDLYVTSEEQRLQTVSRVDQDFDIRRVQFMANKCSPPVQSRPKKVSKVIKRVKPESDSDEELSPTSSIDSSDSEDDCRQDSAKSHNENNSQMRLDEAKKAGAAS